MKFSIDWIRLHKQGKIPKDIPRYPDGPYEKEWKGWSDFLGSTAALSGLQRNAQMRSYEECKKFVRSLGIKTENQWRDWNKNNQRPVDIPYSFQKSYPSEWKKNGGMGGLLGTGFVADKYKEWMSFEKARSIVQKLGFKNMAEYKKERNAGKIPKDIPANPDKVYQDKGWISSGDWFGTGNVSGKIKSENWLTWKDAKPKYLMLAKKYGLKNGSDWRTFTPKHQRELNELKIPAKPWIVYSKERIWKNMK